jgi:serine/threonine-protein kinase
MATVFLATDLRHDRDVAVKVLRPELSRTVAIKRFMCEVRVTARLQHPNILTLIDSGQDQGVLFYVMPYVKGMSLREAIQITSQHAVAEAVCVIDQISLALEHAHTRGVVHRDVKPDNILLDGCHAVLTDFGVALDREGDGVDRVTEAGRCPGTPLYMSAEQARGKREVDGRADQYSLACVLFEMLVGEPPFTGSPQAVIARHARERPPSLRVVRPDLDQALEDALIRALDKEPARRFDTVCEFARRVRATSGLGEEQVFRVDVSSVRESLANRRRRHQGWIRRWLSPTAA